MAAESIRSLLQSGLHVAAEKAADTPEGTPETENETARVAPEIKAVVTGKETDFPAVTLSLPPSDNEKSKLAGTATVSLKDAVCDSDPAVAFTVIAYEPAAVAVDVDTVRVELQVGLHDAAENEAVAPDGRPETVRETDFVVPETRLRFTGNDADCPTVTLPLLAMEREKSKGTGGGVVSPVALDVVPGSAILFLEIIRSSYQVYATGLVADALLLVL